MTILTRLYTVLRIKYIRLFLFKNWAKPEKTQIAQSSNEIKNLAEQGLEYLSKKTAACKEVRVNRMKKKNNES